MNFNGHTAPWCLVLPLLAHGMAAETKKPLQVIIMAGQSNMVGHGFAEGSILHWNATSSNQCGGTVGGCVDPKPGLPPNLNGSLLTAEFSFLRTATGDWAARDDVWIIYNESSADDGLGPGGFPDPAAQGYWHGPLSVGFGGVHKGEARTVTHGASTRYGRQA
eukprot:SAG11_NODE_508_length_8874_cov_5.205812_9_plen_163_part_00